VNGVNNPCPSGYRLPTNAELNAERIIWSSNNTAGAFASALKLTVAGARRNSDGALVSVGSEAVYWTSTVNTAQSKYDFLYFSSGSAVMSSNASANGYSVRCIKN
jgi:uncharacterized protein (TIGR02145 family)